MNLQIENEKVLTHIDLFSGIGGFSLASSWAGFKTVAFCENNEWCQGILKNHWPDTPVYNDVRTFPGGDYKGTTILTGGYPCQPFSQCGKRKGKDDNRYLWPQMLEIIRTSRPSWVVAENVPNVIKMALPTVIPDLEKIGYESVLLLIPALGVGAPHRRRRAWVVSKSLDSNSDGIGLYREKMHEHNQGNLSELENQQGSLVGQMVSPQVWESIDPRVLGVANGLPDRMDREEKQDRINRIKGLGNAIVPQLAYELLKPIAEMELKGYTVSHVNRKKSSHIGSQEEDGSPDIFM